jgi:tetratricopeptide (TPR) repeat protein
VTATSTLREPVAIPSTQRGTLLVWLPALVLFLTTTALFSRSLSADFVELDDRTYVVQNPYVLEGLSADSLWYCLSTPVAGNWHPLTMLSHVLDGQLYGLNPRGHHLTSVLLHAINTALVYLVLLRATGQWAPSLLVALLFGWHPLRAESVAWVSERKDVLSTLFWLWTMWAYLGWVRRPSRPNYAIVALLLTLGLLSKAMLVTLPCALVLFDIWPLGRASDFDFRSRASWRSLGGLLYEKLPLFAIVALFSLITWWAQQGSGAFFEGLPLSYRLYNALASYLAYLGMTFWPESLYIPYLMADRVATVSGTLTAAAGLVLVTVAACTAVRTRPYLTVGWLWFIGTLVPVVGLATQQGYQAMADRFTYIPGLGLAIAVVWLLCDWADRRAPRQLAVLGLSVVVVGALAIATWRQLGYWQDSEALFRHTLDCDGDNYVAHSVVGRIQVRAGNLPAAEQHFQAALAAYPRGDEAHAGLGEIALRQSHWEEAVTRFTTAGQLAPRDASYRAYLAEALSLLGYQPQSRQALEQALAIDPNLITQPGMPELVQVVQQPQRTLEAIERLQNALQRAPEDVVIKNRLARIFATQDQPMFRDGPQALRLAREACDATNHQHPLLLDTLAAAHAELKQFDQAQRVAAQAEELAKAWAAADPRWQELPAQIAAHRQLYRQSQPLVEVPDQAPFWWVQPIGP